MSRATEGNSQRSQAWSEDTDRTLREMVAKKTSKMLIAAKLRRSWSAIQGRMYVLGLTKGTGRGRPARTSGPAEKAEA
jgi:hypothetical protein